MKSYIRNLKKSMGVRKIILLTVLLYFIHGFCGRTFHLPTSYSYVIELCSVLIWLKKPFKNIDKSKNQTIVILFSLMLFVDFIGALVNFVHPFNLLMGFRGIFLPVVLLFASGGYLRVNDYQQIFKFMYYFQWVNVLCTVIQWKIYGLSSDFNNGALMGGAEQNFFCVALIVYYMFAYNNKKESLKKLLFVVASSFFIAIIQDEKFIFVGAMLSVICYFLFQKLRFRNLVAIAVLIVGINVAFNSMEEGQTEAMGTFDNAVEYSQKTGAGYGFPRIGSSLQITEMFLHTDMQKMFGLGLGTCTEMKFPGADLSFFTQYGNLGYHLFVFQDVFLETGWIGVILYIGVFVFLLFYNIKRKTEAPQEFIWLYNIAITLSLISIFLIWYNCTLRIYYAVLPYIILGLGPCVTKTINMKRYEV